MDSFTLTTYRCLPTLNHNRYGHFLNLNIWWSDKKALLSLLIFWLSVSFSTILHILFNNNKMSHSSFLISLYDLFGIVEILTCVVSAIDSPPHPRPGLLFLKGFYGILCWKVMQQMVDKRLHHSLPFHLKQVFLSFQAYFFKWNMGIWTASTALYEE